MAENTFDNVNAQFEQFLSSVGITLSHEKHLHLIQNKLRRHFNSTSIPFLCSSDFQSLLTRVHSLFNQNKKSTKYFKVLNLFDEQLRKHSTKSVRSRKLSNEILSSIHDIQSVEGTVSTNENTETRSSESPISISLKSPPPSTTTEHVSAIEQTTDPSSADRCDISSSTLNESPLTIPLGLELRRKNKIVKLERRLSHLSKTIRELEAQDLSLDEMRDSDLYQVESNLKQQAFDIYKRLADLKHEPSSTERILDQPVTLTDAEIDHPLINKALEDMVNQSRFLPSFSDVLDVVEKTNDEAELDLSVDARKLIAEKALKVIGMKVKSRRMADFHDIMNSRLPEDLDIERDDPALNNVEIENALIENEREAEAKTQKVMEEFSQIDPDLTADVDTESSEGSIIGSDEEDEEGEEVENNNDGAERGSDTNVDSLDKEHAQTDYDVVDIIPPFSSKSSSPSSVNTTENIRSKDPVEATVIISLHNRTLTISSTASIPIKQTTLAPFVSTTQRAVPEVVTILDDDDTIEESQPVAVVREQPVQTIISRRRQEQNSSTEETSYSSDRQRITTNDLSTTPKRTSADVEPSKSKKHKDMTEMVILD